MEHSAHGMQFCRRSTSPVFFTGCTTTPPKLQNNEVSSVKTVTAQDFNNMRLSINSQKTNVETTKPALGLVPIGANFKVCDGPQVLNCVDANTAIKPSPVLNQNVRPALLAPTYIKNTPDANCVNKNFTGQHTPDYHIPINRRKMSHLENAGEPSYQRIGDPNLSQEEFHSARRELDYCNSPNSPVLSLNLRKRKRSPPSRHVNDVKRPHTQPESRHVWDSLSHDIWQLYLDKRQTPQVYQMKMTLRGQLHHILMDTFPSCGLYVVGSSMTGFSSNNSDMDMCLMLSHSEIDQEQEATNILQTVYDIFIQCDFLLNLELIPAKVPILRFKDSISAIEVDLNVNNSVGIRNTQLLTSYSRIDERVPPLILLTKLWARCHDINDAKNHTLSSYSLVLMVIHYLQYACNPPVLPSLQKLQPDKYQNHVDVRILNLREDLPPFRSDNSQLLGDLFLGFLDYFGNKFDFTNHVMSVRVGGILSKTMSMNNTHSPKNKRGHWKHLCIEEPFNLTNTACSVFKDSAFYYVRDVFMRSWNILKSSGNLGSILNMENKGVNYHPNV